MIRAAACTRLSMLGLRRRRRLLSYAVDKKKEADKKMLRVRLVLSLV